MPGAGADILVLDAGATLDDAASARAVHADIGTSLDRVTGILDALNAATGRLQRQRQFSRGLTDVIEIGMRSGNGNLVDVDLTTGSATERAVTIREQLAHTPLAIANAEPLGVASLFAVTGNKT